jgi:hypothetical protein
VSVDDERSGQPTTGICVGVKEQIDQHIRDNQRMILDEIG